MCEIFTDKHRHDFQEYICVEFSLKRKDKLLLAFIYRSPSSDDVNNGNLNISLKKLCNMSYSHLLLFGDMNFPHIDWNNISTDKGAGDCNYELLESIRDCFLDQHIYEPTRGRGETKPSTIDLLFSNEEGMVDNIDISPPLGKSDHSLISFARAKIKKEQRLWNRLRTNPSDSIRKEYNTVRNKSEE